MGAAVILPQAKILVGPQIADLDLPAALKQNHERGVRVDLPSGPDEVVLSP